MFGQDNELARGLLERDLLESEEAIAEQDLVTQESQEGWQLIRSQLQEDVGSAVARVDFDDFFQKIVALTDEQEQEQPVQAVAPAAPQSPSWWASLRQLFQTYPGIPFAAVASAFALALFFGLPMLDPGPDANDCVVDNVASSKTAQVAVLQTENQATGQRMTLIVVNEPPDADDPQDPPTPHARPKNHKDKP